MSIRGLIAAVRSPSARYSIGALVALGAVAGLVFVPTFLFVIEETSTDAFCLLCHDRDIGLEMTGTVHYDNPIGVRVACADCHIPKAFVPKLIYKTRVGIRDVTYHLLGTIDTPEKFEARRMDMASNTWEHMNANDSRECRNCHDESRWDLESQREKARRYHSPALAAGKTCIDCHKGLAHRLPQGIVEDEQLEGIDF